MKIRTLLLAIALPSASLCLSGVAAAQTDLAQFDLAEKRSLEGSWALQLDGVIIFRFDIKRDGSKWSGVWLRPDSFASDGNVFARLKGPVEHVPSMAGLNFAGMVELSFDDPRPGAIPDIFRFRLDDGDTAQLTYVGTDLEPYDLVRVDQDVDMGDWNNAAVYRRPVAEPLRVIAVDVPERGLADRSGLPEPEPSLKTETDDDIGEEVIEESPDSPRIEADFLDGL